MHVQNRNTVGVKRARRAHRTAQRACKNKRELIHVKIIARSASWEREEHIGAGQRACTSKREQAGASTSKRDTSSETQHSRHVTPWWAIQSGLFHSGVAETLAPWLIPQLGFESKVGGVRQWSSQLAGRSWLTPADWLQLVGCSWLAATCDEYLYLRLPRLAHRHIHRRVGVLTRADRKCSSPLWHPDTRPVAHIHNRFGALARAHRTIRAMFYRGSIRIL